MACTWRNRRRFLMVLLRGASITSPKISSALVLRVCAHHLPSIGNAYILLPAFFGRPAHRIKESDKITNNKTVNGVRHNATKLAFNLMALGSDLLISKMMAFPCAMRNCCVLQRFPGFGFVNSSSALCVAYYASGELAATIFCNTLAAAAKPKLAVTQLDEPNPRLQSSFTPFTPGLLVQTLPSAFG